MRRILSLAISLVMLFTIVIPSFAYEYPDYEQYEQNEQYEQIEVQTDSADPSLTIEITDSMDASYPVLSFDIFNNGEGGSPSRPNDSLNHAGLIRMWIQLDGVYSPVPFNQLEVTAELPNGQCAMEFVRINNMWENPGNVNLIDIFTRPAVWWRIYLTATLFGHSVEVTLVNNEFVSVCDTEGHLWCGETGIFEQRPAPYGEETDRLWWWEICSRDGCNFALPIADIYLDFVGDWESATPTVVERLIYTFNVSAKDIFNMFNNGVVIQVEYAMAANNTTVLADNRITLANNIVTATEGVNYWNTDIAVRFLVQMAQGTYGVPPHVIDPGIPGGTPGMTVAQNVFPAWLLEGLRDFGRDRFGLFNEEAGWVMPALQPSHWLYGQAAAKGEFFAWVAENYGDDVIINLNAAGQAGTYPLRRVWTSVTASTWQCNDILLSERSPGESFWIANAGRPILELWNEFRANSIGDGGIKRSTVAYTLQEATEGRNIAHGAQFVAGGAAAAANLLTGDRTVWSNTAAHTGSFWVEWRYDMPFVANRFIWTTGNLIAMNVRNSRMADGWTFSGSNDGETWTVLYTGSRNDTQNLHFTYFYVDLPYNSTAFQYYRLHSPTGGDTNTVQLSAVHVTGNWVCTHNFVSTVVPPTCGAEGFTAMICTICGDETGARTDIVARLTTGHRGSNDFNRGTFFQAPPPAEWLEKWWVDYITFEQYTYWCDDAGEYVLIEAIDPMLWWYEECITCGEAIPVADLYLTFREGTMAQNWYPWAFLNEFPHPDNPVGLELVERWNLSDDDIETIRTITGRLVWSFNVVWVEISNWIQYGLVDNITYTLQRPTQIGSASGNNSNLGWGWMFDRPWDTDLMSHELIHNAQRYTNVPLHIHENVTDYGREVFGIFNDISEWHNPLYVFYDRYHSVADAQNFARGYFVSYRIGARFWHWVNTNFSDVIAERTVGMFSHLPASTGVNPDGSFSDIARAMNYSCKESGRFFPDGRQYIWFTGYTVDELWNQYMEYAQARFARETADWDPGFLRLHYAVGERTLRTDPIFIRGGRGIVHNNQTPANAAADAVGRQGARNLFDGNDGLDGRPDTRYQTHLHVQGPLWAEWRYDEAFVADSFIIQTSQDSIHNPRRMHNGWTLSGSNDGENWTVLYTGTRYDTENFNRRFYVIDLTDNVLPFTHYKLFSAAADTFSIGGPPVRVGTALHATEDCVTVALMNVYLTGEEYVPTPHELSLDIFNNGEGGSPSRPNASLYQAGFIRMWTLLDGVGAPLPYPNLTITAEFPDGTSAMQFVRVNRAWVEGQGWQDQFSSIDVLKGNGDWEIINFSITAFDQTVEVVLVNNRFVPPAPDPILTTTIYAEDWRETINIRFFLDGVLTALPLEDVVFIVDGVVVPDIRAFTVNIAGWQTSTSAVFINKLAHNWHHIVVQISAYGQTLTYGFVNNMFTVHADCIAEGHRWCGVTGHFQQRPAPPIEGDVTNRPWWWEVCGREGCSFALPLADIYLHFVEPGERGHATGNVWNDAMGRSWELLPEGVHERLVHIFNVSWKDIVDWMDFGIVSRVEFVLEDRVGSVGWASGFRSGLNLTWITDRPWDVDLMTHELIHNAQRFSGVAMWVHEGMADFARDKFGIFNHMALWALPGFTADASPTAGQRWQVAYRGTASFFRWIEQSGINPTFMQELNYMMKAPFVTNFQSDVLDTLYRTTGYRGIHNPGNPRAVGGYVNGGLTGHHPLIYAITGFELQDLWTKYWEYSQYWVDYVTADWVRGFPSLAAAAYGRNLQYPPIFIRGGIGFNANEGAAQMFNDRTDRKYCANVVLHGPFWAEWRYAEAFVADRFIWATANDNFAIAQNHYGEWVQSRDRRMGDGWTLYGSVDGINWEVLFVGTTDMYSNFNFTYFYVDLPQNNRAFRYYRLFSAEAACMGDIVNDTVQLYRVALTGNVPG